MRPIPERLRPPALVLAVWGALLPLFAFWMACDGVTAPWDGSGHARHAFDIWRGWKKGDILRPFRVSDYYPPLFHTLAAPVSAVSTHPDAYAAANWFFLLALMAAVYRIVRPIQGPWPAAAAACLAAAWPPLGAMCHAPLIDLALTATVAWTLSVLVADAPLRCRGAAHALGLGIALGMLAKWSYVFFAAVPLAVHLVRAWRNATAPRLSHMARPMLWVVFWPLVLAGPWYWRGIPGILGRLAPQLGGAVARAEGDPAVVSLAGLFAYARILWTDYLTWPLALSLAAGIASLTIGRAKPQDRRRHRYGWLVLLLSLVSGYAALTLIANKDPRYILPAVPALSALGAAWVGRLATTRRPMAALAIAVLSFAMASWGLFAWRPPSRMDMRTEDMAQWIVEHAGEEKCRVLVVPNRWDLNRAALRFALWRRDRDCFADHADRPLKEEDLRKYRYFIVTEPVDSPSSLAPYVAANAAIVQNTPDLVEAARFDRPDGQSLRILGRHPRPDKP